MKFFYFGCQHGAGHYLIDERGKTLALCDTENTPWGYGIDGGLCPPGEQVEGLALLHHKDGWTGLAFWDRSVDSRGGSNSVFIADEFFLWDQMLVRAREKFPWVFDRIEFEIVEGIKV